jgi:hypothetical protein
VVALQYEPLHVLQIIRHRRPGRSGGHRPVAWMAMTDRSGYAL